MTALAVVAVALLSGGAAVNSALHAAAPGSKMHVTEVSVGWDYVGASKQPHAYVLIRDEFGNPSTVR